MPVYLGAVGHCTLKVLQILLRGLAEGCFSDLWQSGETLSCPLNSPPMEQQTPRCILVLCPPAAAVTAPPKPQMCLLSAKSQPGTGSQVSLALILIIFIPGQKNCLKPQSFAHVSSARLGDLCSRGEGGYLAIVSNPGAGKRGGWRHISFVTQILPPGRGWVTGTQSWCHSSPARGGAGAQKQTLWQESGASPFQPGTMAQLAGGVWVGRR